MESGPTASEMGVAPTQENSAEVVSPREKAIASYNEANRVIKTKLDSNFFQTEEDRNKAEEAVGNTDENRVTESNSRAISARIDVLRSLKKDDGTTDDEAKEALDGFSPLVQVRVTGEGKDARYTLEEWEQRLAEATPAERAKLEKSGVYGFKPSKEPEAGGDDAPAADENPAQEDSVNAADKPKDSEDGEKKEPSMNDKLDEHISNQMGFLEMARKNGGDTKVIEAKIRKLQQAREANGDAGALFKFSVLQENGVKNLTEYEEQIGKAAIALKTHLEANTGMTPDEIQKLMQANAGDILKSEQFGKIKGIDQLIFGKPMTSEQIEKIVADKLDPKQRKELAALKKTGDMSLILLMILAGGAMLTSEVVKAGSSTQ